MRVKWNSVLYQAFNASKVVTCKARQCVITNPIQYLSEVINIIFERAGHVHVMFVYCLP